MNDFIIFQVSKNRYAIDLERIQRITQIPDVTEIANAHAFIDGMISYEKRVLNILNFRKMVSLPTYDSELHDLFKVLKEQHQEWVESLKHAVEKKTHFQKTTDPHQCDLGKWLDNFTSYDEHVSAVLKQLNNWHKQLHKSADSILQLRDECHECAINEVETTVYETYDHTISYIDQFINEFDVVADSLQKLLVYSLDSEVFAIKVDSIVDIAHIDETITAAGDTVHQVNPYLEFDGVIEHDGQLVSIIKTIKLPKQKAA